MNSLSTPSVVDIASVCPCLLCCAIHVVSEYFSSLNVPVVGRKHHPVVIFGATGKGILCVIVPVDYSSERPRLLVEFRLFKVHLLWKTVPSVEPPISRSVTVVNVALFLGAEMIAGVTKDSILSVHVRLGCRASHLDYRLEILFTRLITPRKDNMCFYSLHQVP